MAKEIKYKNIIGTGLTDYVQDQINYRKAVTSKDKRSSKDLQWLTNRNSWFRLSSGANFNPSPIDVRYDKKTVDKSSLSLSKFLPVDKFLSPNLDDVQSLDAGYTDDLAKKYILQGGTLKNGNRRTTFKDTYPKGNYDSDGNFLGTEANIKGIKDDLGYKPLPGITNVSVGTRGKWRTTLEADIDFICYNLEQLEIMNKLYMSLGVHVFLEWGHTPYINSSGNIIESFKPINFFDNKFKTKSVLIQEIEKKKKEHHGNYGALLGRVFNFNYSSNPDGSYNCKAQVIGPGAILESIRVNRATRFDFDQNTKENESSKYSSDLANALSSIKNVLDRLEIAEKKQEKGKSASAAMEVASRLIGKNNLGVTTGANFTRNISEMINGPLIENSSYASLLNNLYNKTNYKGYQFEPEGDNINIKYPGGNKSFAAYGNAWQYVSNLSKDVGGGTDNLEPLPSNFFLGYSSKFSAGGGGISSIVSGIKGDDMYAHFITFGHLLSLVQHLCIFNESKSSIVLSNYSNKNDISPIVYIDFHPDNTIMKTGVVEASVDPGKCLIPLNINAKENEDAVSTFDKFFSPLNTVKSELYKWQENGDSNHDKNLVIDQNKELNRINDTFKSTTGESIDGKLMNVLVNIDFAINTLIDLEGNDGNVDLLSYINALLDGINLSLGKINNFRVFFDDCSNVVRIIDEHKTEEIKDSELLILPNFGLDSITYDYGFSSNIGPNLAAEIVIAAQGQNGGIKQFSEDVLSYQQLNINVRDRFATGIYPPLPLPSNTEEQNKIDSIKASQKLFNHIHNIYSLDDASKNEDGSVNLLNAFQDTSRTSIKYHKDKATTLLIPLDINLRIDGITGIMPYNAFLLPENRLPLRYQNNNVAFIIFSIDHEFENNQWTSILKGQIIYRGNPSNIVDDRPINPDLQNLPRPSTRDAEQPLETTTYGGKLNLPFPTGDFSQPKSEPKAQPEPEDTAPIQPPNNTTPTGDNRPSFSPVQVDPQPASVSTDIIKARDFIISNEVPGGVPELTAYKDDDYTVSAGFTYRIGFGSDTITSTTGGVRRVKKGDTITTDQAYLDIERRLKTEFKPKVVATCDANGVNYDSLPGPVKTVFIDCAYNYGSLWNSIVISYRDRGVKGLKAELQRRANSGPGQVPRRREAEIRHLGG